MEALSSILFKHLKKIFTQCFFEKTTMPIQKISNSNHQKPIIGLQKSKICDKLRLEMGIDGNNNRKFLHGSKQAQFLLI